MPRRRTRPIAALIAIAISMCVTLAAAQPPARPETRAIRPNRSYLVAGTAVLVGAYAPSVVVAATSSRYGDQWLYAPVIGPILDLGGREGCTGSGGNCDNEQLYRLLLWTSGIAQIVGVVGIVAAFILPEYRNEPPVAQPAKPEIRIAPIRPARDGYGVAVVGRF